MDRMRLLDGLFEEVYEYIKEGVSQLLGEGYERGTCTIPVLEPGRPVIP